MDRKMGDLAINSPKAQITLFMILGLVILLVFLFLIQLSTRLSQDTLELSKENVLAQAFKKEGLRLYVDDCLQDELTKGLLLLGRQGRLWADQPGGRVNFEPGKTGLVYAPSEQLGEFDSSRVAYGITKKNYIEHENAYPCTEEANNPEFCQYRFPNTSLSFGNLELLPSTLRGDLQRFMTNRTVWCVQQFLLNNVSRQVVLESSPAEVSVEVFDDGISVKSEYPLRFKIGQNKFFHLSTFDFFYSSQFGKFLNDIITFPLQQDQHYLDFNYSPENLNEPFFTFSSDIDLGRNCETAEDLFVCQRSLRHETMSSLSVEMRAMPLENGDDMFIFTPALYKIVNSPERFEFRVARQNRPPALSYINRSQCPDGGYDYLVIKGHETLGEINISAFALDPDEDAIKYEFDNKLGVVGTQEKNNFSVTEEDVANDNLAPGIYEIVVNVTNVTDGYKQSDWQQVRILVDRTMQTSVALESPYEDINYSSGENWYRLSREDPVYLKFSMPEASINSASVGEQVAFNYDDGYGDDQSIRDVGALVQGRERPSGEVCYNLPIARMEEDPTRELKSCGALDGYKEEDVVGGFPPGLNFFERPTEEGRLTLGQTWRLYNQFREDAVFLDIETSGFYGDITIIGMYDGQDTKTMVRGHNLDKELLKKALSQYKLIITFNGASFDLPVIRRYFGDVVPAIPHIDLRHVCSKLDLHGGLKKIEKTLGIRRAEEVEGITGEDAVYLWQQYKATGKQGYLETLVKYNEEDIVNLLPIADTTIARLWEQTRS